MSRKAKAEFTQEGYNITVTGRHVSVTDSMKDYALEKISKIERFSNRIIDVVIIMDIQRYEHRVDFIMKTENIKIKSHAVTDNMYASIDKAAHKLETQLLKYKERIHDHQARGLPSIDMQVNVVRPHEQDLQDINIDIDEENDRSLIDKYRPHEIVRQESIQVKVLNYDEAIMKMELSQDPFIIFCGEDDHKLKVIYRQEDGNFGIVAAEQS